MSAEERRARRDTAVSLRQKGWSFRAIATALGVTTERARQILISEEARKVTSTDTIKCLSTRTYRCLVNSGVPRDSRRDDIARILPRLRRGAFTGPDIIKNFGRLSLAEVEAWVSGTPS